MTDVMTRTKDRLADGTRIDELIDVERREVQIRTLSDHELYDLEMERIFGKAWLLLGHETEIPNPNDFVLRSMGEDQVIVARARDGEIHVSLNVCPHRGMRVCRSDSGNLPVHRCVYHGWAFRPDGAFIGSPVEREKMHGEIRTKAELSLKKARVTVYGGLIFATWDQDGPSFEEFLGDMKWYYDMLFCRTDRGLEVLGPPQRFVLDANWKAASEQSASDGFHTLTLHQWLGEIAGFGNGDLTTSMYGVEVTSRLGHSLRCTHLAKKFEQVAGARASELTVEERLAMFPPPGISKEMVPELMRNLKPDQLKLLTTTPPQVGNLFPNMLIAFVYVPQADGTVLGLIAVHAYVPRGPGRMEFVNWLLAEKDTPEPLKQAMLRESIHMFGTSGMIEQDDSDTWPEMTQVARGSQSRKVTLKYQAINTVGRPADWPGPAEAYDGFTKDDTQWNWWLAYRDHMVSAD
ncbi:Ring hydroxylating alpha subunit (catalytic domain) [Azospirillum oryzae]|uniref:Ring hydroxylating alpha subunit (Catalytic domain) n=1 Tax=Azospirillum oryzae TaxID=286727 RepID=A0A1X7EKJ7_9PROT|nr:MULTISPECIES: aromatic ring-hydroxylating dioxygenase subunit alpha [Azospirillum]SMF35615.1 Ring hydroxylating alpha subunit (catalytic domain) [Azospirillum oryzae]